MPISLDAAYRLDPQVAIRPEPFGALAYHYGSRRLVFLRSTQITHVVQSLDAHDNLAQALIANHVDQPRWPCFVKALESLENASVIHAR